MNTMNLIDLIRGVVGTAALGVAARHKVADLLVSHPLTADEIAARTGTQPDAMHRVLRTLASLGVFHLDANGRFANNDLSTALRTDVPLSLGAFAAHFGSPANLRAYSDIEETVATGKNAFERVHEKTIWQWFDQHPSEGRMFSDQMHVFTLMSAQAIAADPIFSRLTNLCDVAGGRGTQLAEILLHHPSLKAILFDSPSVLALAAEYLTERGVADRVEMIAGSFFDRIPAEADGYVLKDVLHDWDDERTRAVLANIRKSAKPGALLIIVENLLDPNELSVIKSINDLHMMILFGGRQRSAAEVRRLLEQAGFRFDGVTPVPRSIFSVIAGTAV